MVSKASAHGPYSRQVFLNCPFDADYLPLMRRVVFTIHACEFTARVALETTGSERARLERLVTMIGECRLGIHDLSRVTAGTHGLPRFNMPFECGIFYGALKYGTGNQKRKRFLLLDAKAHQHQQTLSDAAGLDPRIHDNDPRNLVACVRDFLADGRDPKPMGPTKILELFGGFEAALPGIARDAQTTVADIEPLTAFNDWHLLAARWLKQRAAGRR